MEFSQLLESRRSIRHYKPGMKISEDQIKVILDAARQAPSWKNSQTGRCYVAISEDKLNYVKTQCLPEFNAKNTENAVAYIITAFEKGCAGFNTDGTPTNEIGDEWGAYDLGLQNENLILKARETGYDSLIMGIRDEAAIRSGFGIPDSQELVAVIAIGVREKDPQKPPRKEIDEIAKFF